MKILIAEDDMVSRKVLQRSLEKWDYDVDAAEDGQEALDLYRSGSYSILITDWMMPRMDGVQLVEKVRAIGSSDYVYIIMLTAKSAKYEFIEAMEAGADDFLSKPLDREELRVRLQAARRVIDLERQLSSQNAELTENNVRMKHDLEAAARIQVSLLPDSPPPLDNFRVDWSFDPCDELAGDIFNVFNLDEDYLGVYLLDVSGHGVSAALLAVTLSRLLSPVIDEASLLKRRLDEKPWYQITQPTEVANQLNKRFQLNPENSQYFTLIYGLLDKKTGEFRFISAGHPQIIHLSKRFGGRLIEAPGIPIGILEENEFVEHSIQMEPGDRIYLYSDGIAEAQNIDAEQFGLQRMVETLQEKSDSPLTESMEHMLEITNKWCGYNSIGDDVSILALEMIDASAENELMDGTVKNHHC
ncbi:MAG: PP2C family protein-serine/threonine phosphatase [Calditrichia bacterium]